jgi:aspartate racemase
LIYEKYVNELFVGVFRQETRDATVQRLKNEERIEGVILGGTKLPLILPETDATIVPFLDTTRIHVDRIVDEILSAELS